MAIRSKKDKKFRADSFGFRLGRSSCRNAPRMEMNKDVRQSFRDDAHQTGAVYVAVRAVFRSLRNHLLILQAAAMVDFADPPSQNLCSGHAVDRGLGLVR